MNPAVTLSLLATRRLDVLRALVYIAAQCLGASLGTGVLYLALPLKTTADHFVSRVSFSTHDSVLTFLYIPVFLPFPLSSQILYATQVPLELNAAQALGTEVLCTFQVVLTVFSVEDQRRRESSEPGNLAIGVAHSAGVLIGVRWEGKDYLHNVLDFFIIENVLPLGYANKRLCALKLG